METEVRKRHVSAIVTFTNSFGNQIAPRRFSAPLKPIGIEYNRKISMDQVIESLKRARKKSGQSDVKSPKLMPFTEDFFESIETFLDNEQMFIVSPTHIRSPRLLKQYLKTKVYNYPAGGTSPKMQSLENLEAKDYDSIKDTTIPSLDLTIENSCISQFGKSTASMEISKSPFLGGVSTSSLLNRRKKFGTMDNLAS